MITSKDEATNKMTTNDKDTDKNYDNYINSDDDDIASPRSLWPHGLARRRRFGEFENKKGI